MVHWFIDKFVGSITLCRWRPYRYLGLTLVNFKNFFFMPWGWKVCYSYLCCYGFFFFYRDTEGSEKMLLSLMKNCDCNMVCANNILDTISFINNRRKTYTFLTEIKTFFTRQSNQSKKGCPLIERPRFSLNTNFQCYP